MDIFIVHNDPVVGEQLRDLLARQGHHVRVSPGISETLPLLEAQRADVLIVDCRQLEVNGAVLFRFLGRWPQPPVILPTSSLLTANDGNESLPLEVERVQAIAAQVQHLLNREDGEIVRVGDLVIDMISKHVALHGQQVLLPPIQFRLLAYLAQNAGRVVGARELLKAVWGYDGDETEARELVKVHVRQIRRKLGLQAQHDDYVQSVRGFGYVVTVPGISPS